MPKYQMRDTILLSGWLFADLLLGLAVIFMVSLPGAQKPPTPPPPIIKWSVSPTILAPNSAACPTGGATNPQCIVTLTETSDSQASLDWQASSDMATDVNFAPAHETLSPGKSMAVTLSHFPCQNGSFTFNYAKIAPPLTVDWRCKLPREQLESAPRSFFVTVNSVDGLLNNSSSTIDDLKQQIRSQSFLRPGNVGIAIVYGGAPTDNDIQQALTISAKVYLILTSLGQEPGSAFQRATNYNRSLYNLGDQPERVEINVYLFQT